MTTEISKIRDFTVYIKSLATILIMINEKLILTELQFEVSFKFIKEIFSIFYKSDMKKFSKTIHNTLFEECFN